MHNFNYSFSSSVVDSNNNGNLNNNNSEKTNNNNILSHRQNNINKNTINNNRNRSKKVDIDGIRNMLSQMISATSTPTQSHIDFTKNLAKINNDDNIENFTFETNCPPINLNNTGPSSENLIQNNVSLINAGSTNIVTTPNNTRKNTNSKKTYSINDICQILHKRLVTKDTTSKPPFSYAQLICLAILLSKKQKLMTAQIYHWISTNFPFYKMNDQAWQSSIRHNLSLNKAFIKVDKNNPIAKYSNYDLNVNIQSNNKNKSTNYSSTHVMDGSTNRSYNSKNRKQLTRKCHYWTIVENGELNFFTNGKDISNIKSDILKINKFLITSFENNTNKNSSNLSSITDNIIKDLEKAQFSHNNSDSVEECVTPRIITPTNIYDNKFKDVKDTNILIGTLNMNTLMNNTIDSFSTNSSYFSIDNSINNNIMENTQLNTSNQSVCSVSTMNSSFSSFHSDSQSSTPTSNSSFISKPSFNSNNNIQFINYEPILMNKLSPTETNTDKIAKNGSSNITNIFNQINTNHLFVNDSNKEPFISDIDKQLDLLKTPIFDNENFNSNVDNVLSNDNKSNELLDIKPNDLILDVKFNNLLDNELFML